MIFWVLVIAYFVQNGVSDLAFHWRGEESPRDARRASRQKAVTDWASGRKAGRKSHPPSTPKAGKSGPWREYFRDLNADCAAGATERRRAMRDNRKARRDRRKTRKAEARARREKAARTPVSLAEPTPGPGERGCRRHIGTRFCNRPTDGSRYCTDCEADLVPGDDPEPDPPVDHEAPTEQEPAPPEDDRPQPVADQPAQPEQPQTSADQPKGTTMPDISAAEGGLEAHIAYDEAVIATLNDLVSSLEHTAADRESSNQGGDAVTGLNEAAEDVGTAKAAVERSLECLLAALVVREANEAADWTAGDKEFLRA